LKVKRDKKGRVILPDSDYKACEYLFTTDGGQKWSLDKMPFFVPIYDKPRNKILLITSRQSTKTTYLRNKSVLRALKMVGNSALYVAPTNNQVSDFSRKKLDNVFAYNPSLKRVFVNRNCAWNVTLKEFDVAGAMSRITLRSTGGAQGAGRIRGGTYNDIFIDEIQDQEEDNLPVIEECAATFDGLDGRPTANYVYTGTPLSTQNIIQRQFNTSRQWQWHIQCPHCSVPDPKGRRYSKNVDLYEREIAMGGWQPPIEMAHLDESKPFLFCLSCGRDMNNRRGTPRKFDGSTDMNVIRARIPPFGTWISHNPKGKFDGYRVVRLMMPWARWRTENDDGVLDRLEGWPERRFVNEVMGMSFDSGQVPITRKMIEDCCTDYDLPRGHDWEAAKDIAAKHQGYLKFAGLDWAAQAKDDETAAYTIVGVFALVHGKMKLIYGHRFIGQGSNNPDKVLAHVNKVMEIFDVTRLGADYGIGYKEVLRLQDIHGMRKVACFEYKGGGQASTSRFDENARKWIVPKTRTLDQLCVEIREKRFILPRYESADLFTRDWMNVSIDFRPDTRSIRYEKLGTDDFLHVANYAHLAKRLEHREGDFGVSPAALQASGMGATVMEAWGSSQDEIGFEVGW
jgi:hypothetical protein